MIVQRQSVPVTYATVPRLWPESTIVCLATGPSLCAADVDACRGQHVIAVNDAYRLAPWAAILYACPRWWQYYQGAADFPGLKYALAPSAGRWSGVQVLRMTGIDGVECDPSGLRSGHNSGFQVLNLAVHLGARRIILLGYDMGHSRKGPSHFFGEHPRGLRQKPRYPYFIGHFTQAAASFRQLGIEVINCSRESRLTCFPRQSLADALSTRLEIAS